MAKSKNKSKKVIVNSKKQISIGKILGIIAMVVAIASIFMGLLPAIAVKGLTTETTTLWELVFVKKSVNRVKTATAIFSILLIGILTVISAVIINLTKKDKISGVIYLVGSFLMVASAILALLFVQIYSIEYGRSLESGVKITYGCILIGVLGITSSGLGIASGVLNLKK